MRRPSLLASFFIGATLLGCATAEPPIPVVKDVPSANSELDFAIHNAAGFARLDAKPVLPTAVMTKQAAHRELTRLYPTAKSYECCEHDGWFLFSTTPLDSPLRFHGGYAVEKNGTRVGEWGLW